MARTPRVPGGESAPEAKPVEADVPASASEEGGIPRAEDVDPTKIRRAVLTTSGWVCPATSPAPAVKQ